MEYQWMDIELADRDKTALIAQKKLCVQSNAVLTLQCPCYFVKTNGTSAWSVGGWKSLVYKDNTLIFLATLDLLLKTLEQVLGLLVKANLKCKPLKCFLYAETFTTSHMWWATREFRQCRLIWTDPAVDTSDIWWRANIVSLACDPITESFCCALPMSAIVSKRCPKTRGFRYLRVGGRV